MANALDEFRIESADALKEKRREDREKDYAAVIGIHNAIAAKLERTMQSELGGIVKALEALPEKNGSTFKGYIETSYDDRKMPGSPHSRVSFYKVQGENYTPLLCVSLGTAAYARDAEEYETELCYQKGLAVGGHSWIHLQDNKFEGVRDLIAWTLGDAVPARATEIQRSVYGKGQARTPPKPRVMPL